MFCTSGLLLKKLQNAGDETVRRCTHLVLDEIHERDANTDILLLAVRRRLATDARLKVVIMSATMDAEKFYSYFRAKGLAVGTPINVVAPTNFPVAHFHLEDVVAQLDGGRSGERASRSDRAPRAYRTPHRSLATQQFLRGELAGDSTASEDTVPCELIAQLVRHLHESRPDGAILCFLPGWEDIVAVQTELERGLLRSSAPHRIYCVHSSSPHGVAESMFLPTPHTRKIILATNIAESSITIPDVAYVVDSGRQKINMYNPALRMNSLKLTWISAANGKQRLGRVGRMRPGEYYFLGSRRRVLVDVLPPEMLRVGLEEACLTVKGLGFVGPCAAVMEELPDRPDRRAVRDAVRRLAELGALDGEDGEITPLGRMLAALPLGPALGRALLLARRVGGFDALLTIAAGVGERVVRMPRFEREKAAFSVFMRKWRAGARDDYDALLQLVACYERGELNARYDALERGFLSAAALKRIVRVKTSLAAQVRGLLSDGSAVSAGMDDRAHMARMLLFDALYPDVAVRMARRNNFLLADGQVAEVPRESVLHQESLETQVECGALTGIRSVGAHAVVFEELFDSGFKMLVKTGVVDPLLGVFVAKRVERRVENGECVVLDGWMRIGASSATLQTLMTMRQVWRASQRALLSPDGGAELGNKMRACWAALFELWDDGRVVRLQPLK